MKQEIHPGVVIGLILLALAVIGGLYYYNTGTDGLTRDQQASLEALKKAKAAEAEQQAQTGAAGARGTSR
jgi:hypothetical protein